MKRRIHAFGVNSRRVSARGAELSMANFPGSDPLGAATAMRDRIQAMLPRLEAINQRFMQMKEDETGDASFGLGALGTHFLGTRRVAEILQMQIDHFRNMYYYLFARLRRLTNEIADYMAVYYQTLSPSSFRSRSVASTPSMLSPADSNATAQFSDYSNSDSHASTGSHLSVRRRYRPTYSP